MTQRGDSPTTTVPNSTAMVEPSQGASADAKCGSAAGVPDCGTGPMGRIRFVLQELKEIIRGGRSAD